MACASRMKFHRFDKGISQKLAGALNSFKGEKKYVKELPRDVRVCL